MALETTPIPTFQPKSTKKLVLLVEPDPNFAKIISIITNTDLVISFKKFSFMLLFDTIIYFFMSVLLNI